jgi:hypothetical protein
MGGGLVWGMATAMGSDFAATSGGIDLFTIGASRQVDSGEQRSPAGSGAMASILALGLWFRFEQGLCRCFRRDQHLVGGG